MELLSKYVCLADHARLRLLETPFLYDRRNDELYELDINGFEALARCDGTRRADEIGLDPAFLETCVEEDLVRISDAPVPMAVRRKKTLQSPLPSLRYLELQTTWRCNLSCRHCYLGQARPIDLPMDKIIAAAQEFEQMGGLRLLLTGGEPLAHPQWPEINEFLKELSVRKVLLTNGLLLNESILKNLNVDEVQISLDGLENGHEAMRGPNSFDRAVRAARSVSDRGIDLSIATMAHSGNLTEFKALVELIRSLGAREWGIDVPCVAGRMEEFPDLAVSPRDGAEAMGYAFGAAYHGSANSSGESMACGLHLCTVSADGRVAQCGYYFDSPLGNLEEGLRVCWERRIPTPLAEIRGCAECDAAADCSGGCRFRAPAPDLPDEVMCALLKD